MRRIVIALCLLCCGAAAAQAPEESWYSVHLDGRKIGHMRTLRALESNGEVRHEQSLVLGLERNGEALRIATDERTWETAAGVPLRFETEINTAGSTARTRAELDERGELTVHVEQQGTEQRQVVHWPSDALLAEGQRLAAERAGFAPGTRYEVLAFDPGSLQPMRIRARVGEPEVVDIHGRSERLIAVDQALELGGSVTETRAWVTPDAHDLRRLRLPAIGLHLEMLACDRACALAPNQPTDVLASTVVSAPEPLSVVQRGRPLRYRLKLARGEGAALDRAPGQTLEALDAPGEYSLVIDPRGESAVPPRAEDTSSNRWLQSDDREVVALAQRAVKGVHGDEDRVAQLERFVRTYIAVKSLRVGYASASEIVRGREGDCTEHAVLLAALARAIGIPARVATGIAYAPRFGRLENVFVPHAWVNVWIDGRWRGYDAALPQFDAGHIAFSVGDGDPFRFYGGIELLGGVEILAIERARRREARAQR